MHRQIWETDYYAEILDLRQDKRDLLDVLTALIEVPVTDTKAVREVWNRAYKIVERMKDNG
jgi:hypothetical protein